MKKKLRAWNEKEIEKQHAKIMQRSWKERQMQDRNEQRYKAYKKSISLTPGFIPGKSTYVWIPASV